MVPTPLFSVILDRISSPRLPNTPGVGQLGAAQVDLAVRHHPNELEDLLPAGDEAGAEHVVDAEGLGGGGGRQGGVVHRVGELLLQLQAVQNQPVAVVGDAQAVRGLAVGGGGEVGADPGGQPGPCRPPRAAAPSSACRARRRPSRGSGSGRSRGSSTEFRAVPCVSPPFFLCRGSCPARARFLPRAQLSTIQSEFRPFGQSGLNVARQRVSRTRNVPITRVGDRRTSAKCCGYEGSV